MLSCGLLDYDTLKMEAAWSPKTLVSQHITTQFHKPEDRNMNIHHHENLKSCIKLNCPSLKYNSLLLILLLHNKTEEDSSKKNFFSFHLDEKINSITSVVSSFILQTFNFVTVSKSGGKITSLHMVRYYTHILL
jgi:hypothetical protein